MRLDGLELALDTEVTDELALGAKALAGGADGSLLVSEGLVCSIDGLLDIEGLEAEAAGGEEGLATAAEESLLVSEGLVCSIDGLLDIEGLEAEAAGGEEELAGAAEESLLVSEGLVCSIDGLLDIEGLEAEAAGGEEELAEEGLMDIAVPPLEAAGLFDMAGLSCAEGLRVKDANPSVELGLVVVVVAVVAVAVAVALGLVDAALPSNDDSSTRCPGPLPVATVCAVLLLQLLQKRLGMSDNWNQAPPYSNNVHANTHVHRRGRARGCSTFSGHSCTGLVC